MSFPGDMLKVGQPSTGNGDWKIAMSFMDLFGNIVRSDQETAIELSNLCFILLCICLRSPLHSRVGLNFRGLSGNDASI